MPFFSDYSDCNQLDNVRVLNFDIDINTDDIDTISKSFKSFPHFSNVFSSAKEFQEQVKEPFRIAIHSEAFNVSINNFFLDDVKNKYEFQLYSVEGTGEQYWISALIENFNELAVMDDFEFKGQVFTVISSKKHSLPVKSYDFSKEYQGWNFIVFPFVNFIQGFSAVKGRNICWAKNSSLIAMNGGRNKFLYRNT